MGLLEIIGDILDKSLRRNLDIAHHDKDIRRNPKYNCDACDKVRVLGIFIYRGDGFRWCYNCANAVFGHDYKSKRMSRRKFYEHVGN